MSIFSAPGRTIFSRGNKPEKMADDAWTPPSPSLNDLLHLKMCADIVVTHEKIGSGAFGHVFAASRFGLSLAIKYVAIPDVAEEATLLAREMVYGSGLSHPNIVRMLHPPVMCDLEMVLSELTASSRCYHKNKVKP